MIKIANNLQKLIFSKPVYAPTQTTKRSVDIGTVALMAAPGIVTAGLLNYWLLKSTRRGASKMKRELQAKRNKGETLSKQEKTNLKYLEHPTSEVA